MNTLKILATSLILLSGTAFTQDINFQELEETARLIACKTECVKSKIDIVKQGPFVVDGITLPADALRDLEQQQSVVSVGMYINMDGDVLSFDESETDVAYTAPAINKLLPIKIFPAAIISENEKTSPIIIGIN